MPGNVLLMKLKSLLVVDGVLLDALRPAPIHDVHYRQAGILSALRASLVQILYTVADSVRGNLESQSCICAWNVFIYIWPCVSSGTVS